MARLGHTRSLSVILVATLVALTLPTLAKRNKQVHQDTYVTNTSRIFGGRPVQNNGYPWQVYMDIRTTDGEEHFCGGAIIAPYWILSAAHCFTDEDMQNLDPDITATQIRVYPDIIDRTQRDDPNVLVFSLHPEDIETDLHIYEGYREGVFTNNDIALIRVRGRPIYVDGGRSGPIALSYEPIHDGTELYASGWGKINTNSPPAHHLQSAPLVAFNWEECEDVWEDYLTENMICTRRFDTNTCKGDSGGALIDVRENTPVLIGIVSFGLRDQCIGNYPHVSTKFSVVYWNWINRVMAELGCQRRSRGIQCPKLPTKCKCTNEKQQEACKAACSCERSCPDKTKDCSKLAAKGKCKIPKIFKKCKLSCACDNCFDLWSTIKCQEMAEKGGCENATYKIKMAINCKATCNKCEICKDGSKKCPKLSVKGKCTKRKVLKMCQKSCTEYGFPELTKF